MTIVIDLSQWGGGVVLYKVGECIFLLSFCQFKWLSWGALFWSSLSRLCHDNLLAALFLNRLWTSPLRENHEANLEMLLFVSVNQCCFVWCVSLHAINYLTATCIRLTDRTSETCKYLKDFSEISPCHIDFCMKSEKKRWMSTGWDCHRTGMRTVRAHQSKSCPLERWPREDVENNTEMQSNWSQYECNVCLKRGFSLIL